VLNVRKKENLTSTPLIYIVGQHFWAVTPKKGMNRTTSFYLA
jgi:hypothetical protein